MRNCIEGCDYDGRNYFECNYCGEKHCSKHRLPEKHGCIALSVAKTHGPDFRKISESGGNRGKGDNDRAENQNAVDANQHGPSTECKGCGSYTPQAFDFCLECRENRGILTPSEASESDSDSKKRCLDCSATIPSDKDRCIDCRREEQLIDFRGPDVAADGSVKDTPTDPFSANNKTERDKPSAFRRLKRVVGLPVRRFRRAYRLTSLWNVILAVAVILLTVSLLFGIGPIAQFADGINDGTSGVTNTSSSDSEAADNESGGIESIFTTSDLDVDEIEEEIHELINEERSAAGQSSLSYDEDLEEIARSHSQDMAEREYFSHTTPDGADVSDRYSEHGYACEISLGGGAYIDGGGENIAQTYYNERVLTEDGTETYESEEELAEGIVQQWMNSPGHKENLLQSYWQNQGIGVHVTDDGKVFATQNFC